MRGKLVILQNKEKYKNIFSLIYEKNELTYYLNNSLFTVLTVNRVIVDVKKILTNLIDLDPLLYKYKPEETGTGIVLQARDIERRDRFSELVISRFDADALFIFLLYYFKEI